jgi:hypothetical protein
MSSDRRGRTPWRAILLGVALTFAGVATGVALVSDRDAGGDRALPWAAHSESAAATPVEAAAADATRLSQSAAAARPVPGCEACHGELELLRQQTGSLTRAQAVFVPDHIVAMSAHGEMSCAECHTGYATYPHPEGRTSTETCASCHAPADSLWAKSLHAAADTVVTCAKCHGGHDIRTADELRTAGGVHLANAPCQSCHETSRIEPHRPHADTVMCASCHAPHDTRAVDDPESWLGPARQMQTCGTCHDSIAGRWRTDIHGDAELRRAHLAGREALAEVVVCTSCHTGHEMASPDDPTFMLLSVERCSSCHENAARTFYNSYHGRATALGSRVSATCADCHGAHTILPDSFPASHVAQANLVETCAACHPNSRPAFVRYDSHPDPFNMARNPWIFLSFVGMNALLVFVLLVFGTHTLLWWLRLWLDKRRGIIHGIGVHHGPGHGHGHGDEHDEGHGEAGRTDEHR